MSAYELTKTILKDLSSLKAYYRMEAGALTTDSSGNSNTLTNNNTVADGTGIYGGGADQGTGNTNKYLGISTAVGIANTGPVTFSMWFKCAAEIASGGYGLLSMGISGVNAQMYLSYEYNSGTRRLSFNRVRQGIAIDTFTYNVTLGTTWHHLIYSWSGSAITGWLDGKYIGTVASSGGNAGGSSSMAIGLDFINGYYFSGVIDDFAVFSSVLTADQIKELYEGRYIGEWMPQANLVGLWHLNGNSTDSSGNNNHGTDTAITYSLANGKIAQGAGFNGTTSFISIPDTASTSFTTAITAMTWIKLDVTTSGRTIIAKPRSAGGYGFSFDVSTGKLSLVLNNGTTGYQLDGNTTMSTGTWYHAVCTWDGTTGRVYLNGSQDNSSTTPFSSIADSAEAINIGRQNAGLAQYFDGAIDEVAIFSRALTAAEIRHWYAWSSGRYI